MVRGVCTTKTKGEALLFPIDHSPFDPSPKSAIEAEVVFLHDC